MRPQGSKWIRPIKRLAIYLRDGMACAYCGKAIEDSENSHRFTLDHLKPTAKGGTNAASNLVTCCLRCNSRKQDRFWIEFAMEFDNNIEIIHRIKKLRRRDYRAYLVAAQGFIIRRNPRN